MKREKKNFTLVELLAVIAIIGILAGILIPVLGGAQLRGKITQAKSDMKTIETALEAFAADNGGRYMIPGSGRTAYAWGGSSIKASGNAFKITGATTQKLIGELSDPENVTCSNNKRKIRYLEPSKGYDGTLSTENCWPDPWGNSYVIWITDGTKSYMTPHGTHKIYSNILLWSWGPDGSSNNGANAEVDNCTTGVGSTKPTDDVASWHK